MGPSGTRPALDEAVGVRQHVASAGIASWPGWITSVAMSEGAREVLQVGYGRPG
ncbi:hypothetical protein SHIRM173S_13111 [Streptomyces hirsutus]